MKQCINLETVLKQEKQTKLEQIWLVLTLSIPAILAQLTSIAMQYIDAAMVGNMGANATGAIGLVSTSTWLVGGMCIGMASGFYVQVAQLIGAKKEEEARNVLRQGLSVLLICSLVLACISVAISPFLPVWLGGEEEIWHDASTYFMIFSLVLPFRQMRQLCHGMLQCSGDMKTPSFFAGLICVLDVIFNFFLIFPTRTCMIPGASFTIPGANLGVKGAALGTALSEVVISLCMLYAVCIRSKKLAFCLGGSFRLRKATLLTAVKIAVPSVFDHVFMCSAYVAGTLLIAPLGTVAVAANSLSITAESLCYMPGYGIGQAATVIVGHTLGADRRDLTRTYSRLSVMLGAFFMGILGIVMYLAAPGVFSLLTSDAEVARLGMSVLRIELFAEPFYAASICCEGVFRGAGDTLVPGILNLVSMWGVRIGLAFFMVPIWGLAGYWIAMAIELCFRGIIFLIRLYFGKWQKRVA